MISVIVPVYNSEKYLKRCIDSILTQTYTNFELILIDDGSTDSSGIICDEYAEKDNRIIVFHQDNQGQAIARNVGLDYIFEKNKSDWIAFVDSDDYIHNKYLETLLSNALNNDVQISICNYSESEILISKDCKNFDMTSVWNTEDFFCKHTMLSVVLWGKLFAKDCFKYERFQNIKMFEDSYVMISVFFACRSVCYCDIPLYLYFQSENSIMRSEWNPERLKSLELYEKRAVFFKEKRLKRAFDRNILSYVYDLNNQIEKCKSLPQYTSELKRMRRMLGAFLIKNRKTIIKSLSNRGVYYKNSFPKVYRLYYICIKKIPSAVINYFKIFMRYAQLRLSLRFNILSSQKTIKRIIKDKLSVSRFGDGEFGIMFFEKSIGFQDSSIRLKDDLIKTFSNHNQDLLVCIPGALNTTIGRKKYNRDYWIKWGLTGNQQKLKSMIEEFYPNGYLFGDAQITRPYMSYKTSNNAKKVFPLLKRIWEKRDVLIVEGSNTCLGVGNDLFSNVTSKKRILAPNVNAFNYIDDIMNAVTENYCGELVLIALGPTATVLASKLCDNGIQALDIGHIDLEYIWYLNQSKEITPIENRYVNESGTQTQIEECKDEIYQKEIVKRIAC